MEFHLFSSLRRFRLMDVWQTGDVDAILDLTTIPTKGHNENICKNMRVGKRRANIFSVDK